MCHLDAVPEVEDQFPQVLVRGSDHRGPEEHVGEDTGLLTQAVLVPPVVLVQPQAEFLSSDINTVRKPLLLFTKYVVKHKSAKLL